VPVCWISVCNLNCNASFSRRLACNADENKCSLLIYLVGRCVSRKGAGMCLLHGNSATGYIKLK
jgi:hypothetical protein